MVALGVDAGLRMAFGVGFLASVLHGCNSLKDRRGAAAEAASPALEWAQWPAPNSSAEVSAGAPHPQSYAPRGDGTVTDNVTGLTWQQAVPANRFTWADAIAYCTGATLAGETGWRLPTYVELVSIADYSRAGPAIDATYFPATPADLFWSSTPWAGASKSAWFLDFGNGSSSEYGKYDASNSYNVRCVRALAADPVGVEGRYSMATGTVYDAKTKLTWQLFASATPYTWADAKRYCSGLLLNGTGWRLPTIKELVTLVDVTKQATASIDTMTFLGATTHYSWASTPLAGAPKDAWLLNFGGGAAYAFGDVSLTYDVRCVR